MNRSLLLLLASLALLLAIITITRYFAKRYRRTVTSTRIPPWLHPCPACHSLLEEDRHPRLHRAFLHCQQCDFMGSFPIKPSSELPTCLAVTPRNRLHAFVAWGK